MKNFALVSILILFLSGCIASTAPLTKSETSQIKTIAFTNNFPQLPSFNYIGTTVFNNKSAEIPVTEHKNHMSQIFTDLLKNEGYDVFEIDKKSDADRYDLFIELEPTIINDMVGTMGYGVYLRSSFGIKSMFTFTNITVKVLHKDKQLPHEFTTRLSEPLKLDDIPETWESLTVSQQNSINLTLTGQIDSAVRQSLIDSGLIE